MILASKKRSRTCSTRWITKNTCRIALITCDKPFNAQEIWPWNGLVQSQMARESQLMDGVFRMNARNGIQLQSIWMRTTLNIHWCRILHPCLERQEKTDILVVYQVDDNDKKALYWQNYEQLAGMVRRPYSFVINNHNAHTMANAVDSRQCNRNKQNLRLVPNPHSPCHSHQKQPYSHVYACPYYVQLASCNFFPSH
jgi:hypothetical protein